MSGPPRRPQGHGKCVLVRENSAISLSCACLIILPCVLCVRLYYAQASVAAPYTLLVGTTAGATVSGAGLRDRKLLSPTALKTSHSGLARADVFFEISQYDQRLTKGSEGDKYLSPIALLIQQGGGSVCEWPVCAWGYIGNRFCSVGMCLCASVCVCVLS